MGAIFHARMATSSGTRVTSNSKLNSNSRLSRSAFSPWQTQEVLGGPGRSGPASPSPSLPHETNFPSTLYGLNSCSASDLASSTELPKPEIVPSILERPWHRNTVSFPSSTTVLGQLLPPPPDSGLQLLRATLGFHPLFHGRLRPSFFPASQHSPRPHCMASNVPPCRRECSIKAPVSSHAPPPSLSDRSLTSSTFSSPSFATFSPSLHFNSHSPPWRVWCQVREDRVLLVFSHGPSRLHGEPPQPTLLRDEDLSLTPGCSQVPGCPQRAMRERPWHRTSVSFSK